MPEETPPAAPARLASARPFSSARRVSLGEAHCATTALRPWGEAAGHGQVPPASAAVGAAVGDGGAGSPDGPVLLHLALLREQLEALAKKMEHNQCSLLGAIGVVERQCRPGGAGAPQSEEQCAAAAPGSQGTLEVGAPGSAPGASSGEPEPQAPPRAPGGAGSPAGDDEESVPDTPVSPHADAAEQRAAPASSKAHDSERSGRRKGTESSLDVPYFFFSMNKRGSSLRETEVHELSAVTAQMSSHQATIKKHRLTLDHRNKEIRAWAEKLVATSQFETIVAGSIVFNAVAIGWNSDWSMRNIGSDRPIFFIALDWIFLSVFMLELLLRMVAEGGQFFHYRAKMFGWNMFDSGIIALTLLNNAEVLGVRLSVVRVFRVMRLVSVIRVVRLMNGFMELRMMVDGIMNCGKTLLWSFLLLIVLTFIYAVVCLEFIAEWLTQAEQDMGGASTAGLAPADQELMASTMTFVKDNYLFAFTRSSRQSAEG
ncbi:unnamed protein product [Prorocentrum cordatum]|uniref:Ion transport domain-containing protein n=1 Tax=Prorocentrum cordatum TaxID=2364126 RepID=A0ABN9WUA9_9DINO|nr:unnamed protein product [Polarella glacialis]